MLRDFIINISLLISCFVILGEVFKSRPLSPHLSWPLRAGWAVGYGIVGIILMQFSLHLKFGVIADLRHLAIVIPAVYGGMGAALAAAGIMAAARLVMFGVTPTSIYAAAGILLIGLICGLLFRLRLGFALKAFLMNVFSLAAIIVLFYLHLEERELLCLVLSYHIPISLLGGAVAFYVTHFIRYSNEARRRVAENEGKFRQLTERYESVVNNVQEIIFQTDWKGRWTFLNPAWEHLTGYPVKESLGTPFTRYLHPDDLAGKEERYSAVTSEWKESLHLITRYETREKETRWMEIRAKVLKDENGLVTGTSGTMNDITVRKEAEDALQEANRKLQVLSSMDGLTNIANRRFFNERLEHECRVAGAAARHPPLLSLILTASRLTTTTMGTWPATIA
ncbi:PAS domain S-box protein [Paenibacillus sp. CC-CFT747]|nr:PAS domain S-box protein [Paenibacillus sp. CC-CFT747]